ncbi:PREDICTED: leucine-rich repeat receptor [Prunus dulcis]|uniref:PREDICTED: leucine-rich repeat receptor n=1 Tax=Prunus dulcis TaxID=3755 RepID=A0A5E4GLT9_PRUDU|nr:PREDICTED: leucine-rich repeat receptor [Prunus dulcis]
MRKYIGPVLGILCSFPLDNSSSRIIASELDGGGYDGFITLSIGNLTEVTIINLNKKPLSRTDPRFHCQYKEAHQNFIVQQFPHSQHSQRTESSQKAGISRHFVQCT